MSTFPVSHHTPVSPSRKRMRTEEKSDDSLESLADAYIGENDQRVMIQQTLKAQSKSVKQCMLEIQSVMLEEGLTEYNYKGYIFTTVIQVTKPKKGANVTD